MPRMLHTVRQARDSPETGLAGVQHTHKDHHPSLDCPFPMARLSHFIMFILKLQAQRIKSLPVMQETWVESLGWEDPLEKEMATHSSILAWRIPRIEEPGRLQSMGLQRVRYD